MMTNWMEKMGLALAASGAVLGLALAPLKAQSTKSVAAGKKPNIVFILTDNLGYGELGVYGGGILRGAPTPRIDKLASEGTRLLNFNVEAQCTPSRSALMTGRFSIRSGTYEVPIGRDVFARISTHPQSQLDELLPDRWLAAQISITS
jgi:Sulfatase